MKLVFLLSTEDEVEQINSFVQKPTFYLSSVSFVSFNQNFLRLVDKNTLCSETRNIMGVFRLLNLPFLKKINIDKQEVEKTACEEVDIE